MHVWSRYVWGDGRSFFTILYNYYFTNKVSKKICRKWRTLFENFSLILLSKVKEKCVLITVANVHVYWLFIGVVGNSKCNKQRVYEGERKSWLNTCVICCIFPSETKYLSRQFYFSGISYLTLLKRRVSYFKIV